MSVRGTRRRAAILAVGDELLCGQQIDTNSSWLSGKLLDDGWQVEGFAVLGDDEQAICERLIELRPQVELILVTGGLGPTLDDVTRHGVALAAGRELVMDESALARLERLFSDLGRDMASSNRRQALLPEGAVLLENRSGTAPGFRLQLEGGCWMASFPGPPRELYPMYLEEFRPWLQEALPCPERARVAHFNLFGIPESEFASRVGDWMARDAQPRMGVCASGRVLKVRIDGTGTSDDGSEAIFRERVAEFREQFSESIFSETDSSTARALGKLLLEEGISCACAESCTGGEIAARLIAVEGISEVFLEGFVTYSNAAKIARLGVDQGLLAGHGAVSAEVAGAMAAGAARVAGARLAISTTGVAGPEGGTPEKPVGLVHVGVCLDGEVRTHELRFPPRGRDLVRDWASTSACELARRALVEARKKGG